MLLASQPSICTGLCSKSAAAILTIRLALDSSSQEMSILQTMVFQKWLNSSGTLSRTCLLCFDSSTPGSGLLLLSIVDFVYNIKPASRKSF